MKARTLIICCILCLIAYLSFIFPVSIYAENEEKLSCEKSRITVATAARTNPQPSYVINKETINVICDREGYSKAAKKKNINGALVVGLIGTAIIITTLSIIVVANGGFAPDLDLGPIPINFYSQ